MATEQSGGLSVATEQSGGLSVATEQSGGLSVATEQSGGLSIAQQWANSNPGISKNNVCAVENAVTTGRQTPLF